MAIISCDLLIIGAGAAGLQAARLAAEGGCRVVVLEALDRTGGRIHTLTGGGFSHVVEAGAEFVHGDLPVTQGLLKEAGIFCRHSGGKTWQVQHGVATADEPFIEDWPLLIERLEALQEDVPLAVFLEKYLGEPAHEKLRASVVRFAEGYDAADIHRVSTFALRREWLEEGEAPQYRVLGGYHQMIAFLESKITAAGGRIYLSSPVGILNWERGHVWAIVGPDVFMASRALITVSLGVWQLEEGRKGYLRMEPSLPAKRAAAATMGFGTVTKVLLEFSSPFWERAVGTGYVGRNFAGVGFLFSDAELPTWWSQAPEGSAVLTGWWAGQRAAGASGQPEEVILQLALRSLAYVLDTTEAFLRAELKAFVVADWGEQPYVNGAYAYPTLETPEARRVLMAPVEETLFFAGEAFYDGAAMGTVEAALTSGRDVARVLMAG